MIAGWRAVIFLALTTIIDFLASNCQAGDVVAILSNGGFDNIHARLLARLKG